MCVNRMEHLMKAAVRMGVTSEPFEMRERFMSEVVMRWTAGVVVEER